VRTGAITTTVASVVTAAVSILLLVLLEMMAPTIASPEEEATTLLAFTRALVVDDPRGALAAWARNSTDAPCSWAGVSCKPQRPVPRRRAPPRGAPRAPGTEERKRGEGGGTHQARP
jgi:hypothetical protein